MEKGKKWYQSPSNWIVIVACVILIPILIINLSIMFQAKTNEDEVPSIFGIKPFMVLSGSMETEIKKGDLIITKIVNPETLGIDDVIAFRDAEGTVTTHRIIDVVERNGETYFITKGDNNSSQDQNLVSLDDVEGIYITRIPGIGSMMKSLSEPTTIMVIGLGITVIFVISFSISNKKQREIERQEFLEYKRMKEQEERAQQVDERPKYQKNNNSRDRDRQYRHNNERSNGYSKQHHSNKQHNSNNQTNQNRNSYDSNRSNRQHGQNKNNRNSSYNKNRQNSSRNSRNNNQNGSKSNRA